MRVAIARRAFLERSEIPGLVLGVLRGDATSLRRILGARRAGRLGLLAGALCLALAAPPPALWWLALLQLALGPGVAAAARSSGLGPREALRLGLWAVFPLLALAAPLRLAWPSSALPALAALLLGHLLLWRGLRRGLERVSG